MIKREEGSVSIYLLIILSAFLVLFSVLVDAIHIRLADYHATSALRSALRSSLSDTDPSLRNYGLYAMDQARTSRLIFNETITHHQEAWPDKWTIEETHFQTLSDHSLGDHDVLYRQILETMKYEAPIEFGLQVIQAFHQPDTRSKLLETTTLFRQSEQLETLISQRDAQLRLLWVRMERLFGETGTIRKRSHQWQASWAEIDLKVMEIGGVPLEQLKKEKMNLELDKARKHVEIESLYEQLSIEEISDQIRDMLLRQIDDLYKQVEWIEHDLSVVIDKLNLYEEVDQDILFMLEDMVLVRSDIIDGSATMLHHLQSAKQFNEQIEQMTGQFMEREQNEALELHLSHEELLGYAKPAAFFQTLRAELGKFQALYTHLMKEMEEFHYSWNEEPPFNNQKTALIQFVDHYIHVYNEQKRIEADMDASRQNSEEERQGYLQQLRQVLGQLSELFYQCEPGHGLHYEQLNRLETKYRSKNNSEDHSQQETILEEGASFESDQVAGDAIGFLEQMQKAMIIVRDKAYLNEYVLSYFQYRTLSAQEKDSIHRAAQRRSMLAGQEAEYILYGFSSCEANHGAAFAELFAFRLGIRMTETLLDSKRYGVSTVSPMIAFLWAAAESAGKAFHDVRQLVAGEAVMLSEKFPMKVWLSYDDYLRLFLLLHGNKEKSLARIQALLELSTGKNLFTSNTYTQASIHVRVEQLFNTFSRKRTFTDSYYY